MTATQQKKYVRFLNWSEYQHYSDRNPPWVKLHRTIITSEFWVNSSDASRVLAIACMTLASMHDNLIPLNLMYIKRVAYLNTDADFSELLSYGLVEIIDKNPESASNVLAECLQVAIPETETETEKISSPSKTASNSTEFEEFWQIYPRKVGKLQAQKAFAVATKKTPAAAIIAKLKTYKFSDDPKFIPHAATWLNQGRWMDEATPTQPVNGRKFWQQRPGGL